MDKLQTIEGSILSISEDDYFLMSEDRKIVTPENIGGLIEYPALFRAMQDDRELRPALSEPMATGRAMNDFLSMSGEDFLKAYVVADGPVNQKTGKPYGVDTKAYAEWRATQEKTPISTEQYNMFGKMATAYNEHQFIKDIAKGSVLKNVILSAKVAGVDCACKIDSLYVNDDSVFAVDVKTANDLFEFRSAASRLHYRDQQGLISAILHEIGIKDVQTRIAAIEKGPIPRCGIFGVHELPAIEEGVLSMLGEYSVCQSSGVYTTRFEAPKLI